MADLSELDRSGSVKIAGSDATGLEDNFMNVDANGSAFVGIRNSAGTFSDYNFGAVGAATLRTASQLGNATGSADFGTGSATAQTLRVTLSNFPVTLDTNYGTVSASTLRTAAQIGNATAVADFNAGANSAQTLRTASNLLTAGTALTSTLISAKQSLDVNIAGGTISVGVADKTTFTYGTTTFEPIGGVFQDTSPALTAGQSGAARLTANREQLVADIINTSGQNRAQSVTTSAAEALGAASILANRKFISLTPTNGTIYWGFVVGVTTSTGSPIFKNQCVTIAASANVHIYVIAGATTDVRIAEGS